MDIWEFAQELIRKELFTLGKGGKKHFSIITVQNNTLTLHINSTNKKRPIQKDELVQAWKFLRENKTITRTQIRDHFSEANPAYVAGILAQLPGVRFENDPIIKLYWG